MAALLWDLAVFSFSSSCRGAGAKRAAVTGMKVCWGNGVPVTPLDPGGCRFYLKERALAGRWLKGKGSRAGEKVRWWQLGVKFAGYKWVS
jgi:hypothetical protein